MKPKPPTREEANLDAVGRVVGGEHLRARRRRRLIEVHRPEHAHGGEADDVVAIPAGGAAAAARPRCRRQEEGQLVRVGVQRSVQEHVHVHRGGGGRLAGVAAVRGDRERAAAQDVARDGGPRELEPPRAAHEADGDPRGRGPARHRRHRRRWERDGGQVERGGEGERGRQEEQEWRQQRGQAAPRAEVVRRDRRRRRGHAVAAAAAAAGLHLASFVVTHGHSRARPAYYVARSIASYSTAPRRRWWQRRQQPTAAATQHVRTARRRESGGMVVWWAGGAARVALRSRGPARRHAGGCQARGRSRLVGCCLCYQCDALPWTCDAMPCVALVKGRLGVSFPEPLFFRG
jgi:hypothetical protein